ncbi:MAG: hypothetical protein PVG39_10240 [Desulfobacteraceae bacterium]
MSEAEIDARVKELRKSAAEGNSNLGAFFAALTSSILAGTVYELTGGDTTVNADLERLASKMTDVYNDIIKKNPETAEMIAKELAKQAKAVGTEKVGINTEPQNQLLGVTDEYNKAVEFLDDNMKKAKETIDKTSKAFDDLASSLYRLELGDLSKSARDLVRNLSYSSIEFENRRNFTGPAVLNRGLVGFPGEVGLPLRKRQMSTQQQLFAGLDDKFKKSVTSYKYVLSTIDALNESLNNLSKKRHEYIENNVKDVNAWEQLDGAIKVVKESMNEATETARAFGSVLNSLVEFGAVAKKLDEIISDITAKQEIETMPGFVKYKEDMDKLLGGAHPLAPVTISPEEERKGRAVGAPLRNMYSNKYERERAMILYNRSNASGQELTRMNYRLRDLPVQQQRDIEAYKQRKEDNRLREQLAPYEQTLVDVQKLKQTSDLPKEVYQALTNYQQSIIDMMGRASQRLSRVDLAKEVMQAAEDDIITLDQAKAELKRIASSTEQQYRGTLITGTSDIDKEQAKVYEALRDKLPTREMIDMKSAVTNPIVNAIHEQTGILKAIAKEGLDVDSKFLDASVVKPFAVDDFKSARKGFFESLFGKASGGSTTPKEVSGRVFGPGGPKEDKILAKVSPGEYVVRASSVSRVGMDALEYINKYGKLPEIQTAAEGGIIAKIKNWVKGKPKKLSEKEIAEAIKTKSGSGYLANKSLKKSMLDAAGNYAEGGIFKEGSDFWSSIAEHTKKKRMELVDELSTNLNANKLNLLFAPGNLLTQSGFAAAETGSRFSKSIMDFADLGASVFKKAALPGSNANFTDKFSDIKELLSGKLGSDFHSFVEAGDLDKLKSKLGKTIRDGSAFTFGTSQALITAILSGMGLSTKARSGLTGASGINKIPEPASKIDNFAEGGIFGTASKFWQKFIDEKLVSKRMGLVDEYSDMLGGKKGSAAKNILSQLGLVLGEGGVRFAKGFIDLFGMLDTGVASSTSAISEKGFDVAASDFNDKVKNVLAKAGSGVKNFVENVRSGKFGEQVYDFQQAGGFKGISEALSEGARKGTLFTSASAIATDIAVPGAALKYAKQMKWISTLKKSTGAVKGAKIAKGAKSVSKLEKSAQAIKSAKTVEEKIAARQARIAELQAMVDKAAKPANKKSLMQAVKDKLPGTAAATADVGRPSTLGPLMELFSDVGEKITVRNPKMFLEEGAKGLFSHIAHPVERLSTKKPYFITMKKWLSGLDKNLYELHEFAHALEQHILDELLLRGSKKLPAEEFEKMAAFIKKFKHIEPISNYVKTDFTKYEQIGNRLKRVKLSGYRSENFAEFFSQLQTGTLKGDELKALGKEFDELFDPAFFKDKALTPLMKTPEGGLKFTPDKFARVKNIKAKAEAIGSESLLKPVPGASVADNLGEFRKARGLLYEDYPDVAGKVRTNWFSTKKFKNPATLGKMTTNRLLLNRLGKADPYNIYLNKKLLNTRGANLARVEHHEFGHVIQQYIDDYLASVQHGFTGRTKDTEAFEKMAKFIKEFETKAPSSPDLKILTELKDNISPEWYTGENFGEFFRQVRQINLVSKLKGLPIEDIVGSAKAGSGKLKDFINIEDVKRFNKLFDPKYFQTGKPLFAEGGIVGKIKSWIKGKPKKLSEKEIAEAIKTKSGSGYLANKSLKKSMLDAAGNYAEGGSIRKFTTVNGDIVEIDENGNVVKNFTKDIDKLTKKPKDSFLLNKAYELDYGETGITPKRTTPQALFAEEAMSRTAQRFGKEATKLHRDRYKLTKEEIIKAREAEAEKLRNRAAFKDENVRRMMRDYGGTPGPYDSAIKMAYGLDKKKLSLDERRGVATFKGLPGGMITYNDPRESKFLAMKFVSNLSKMAGVDYKPKVGAGFAATPGEDSKTKEAMERRAIRRRNLRDELFNIEPGDKLFNEAAIHYGRETELLLPIHRKLRKLVKEEPENKEVLANLKKASYLLQQKAITKPSDLAMLTELVKSDKRDAFVKQVDLKGKDTFETERFNKAIENAKTINDFRAILKFLGDKVTDKNKKDLSIYEKKANGGSIQFYAGGGDLTKSGLYYGHQGERVLSKSDAKAFDENAMMSASLREGSIKLEDNGLADKIADKIKEAIESSEVKLEDTKVKVDTTDARVPVDIGDYKIPIDTADVKVGVDVGQASVPLDIGTASSSIGDAITQALASASIDVNVNQTGTIGADSIDRVSDNVREVQDKLITVKDELDIKIESVKDEVLRTNRSEITAQVNDALNRVQQDINEHRNDISQISSKIYRFEQQTDYRIREVDRLAKDAQNLAQRPPTNFKI